MDLYVIDYVNIGNASDKMALKGFGNVCCTLHENDLEEKAKALYRFV